MLKFSDGKRKREKENTLTLPKSWINVPVISWHGENFVWL
jgi:hypothetical protein